MDNTLQNPKAVDEEVIRELLHVVERGNWRRATSAQYQGDLAHEYHLAKDDVNVFDTLKKAIARWGYDAMFGKIPHRYLWIGDYKYWAYDTLVNREHRGVAQGRIQKLSGGTQ